MNKTIKSIFKMKIYMLVNMVLFYTSLLPGIGGLVKSTSYEQKGVKDLIGVCVFIIHTSIIAVIKSAAAFLFIVFPSTWLLARKGILLDSYTTYYMQGFFFLFCVLGSFQQSRTFTVTKTKYACFEYFKIPVKKCIIAHLLIEYSTQFVSILLVFVLCQIFLQFHFLQWVILYIGYVSLQLAGEAFYLYYFLKKGEVLSKKIVYDILLIIICAMGAYYPLFMNNPIFIVSIFTHPIAMCIQICVGIYSIYYIFWSYQGYNANISKQMNPDDLIANVAQRSYQKELMGNLQKTVDEMEYTQETYGKKRGYSRLNALFQLRLKKTITRSLCTRVTILLLGAVFCVIYFFYDPVSLTKFVSRMDRIAAIYPIIIYQLSFGDKYCKILFHNCDAKLLEYGFYRKKDAILKNYFIRMKVIVLHNTQLGILLCFILSLLWMLCGQSIFTIERILIFITIMNFFMTFGIHHLSVYYAIQPYIVGSSISNPLIVVSQMGIMLLTFLFMSVALPSIYVMIILNIIGILYDLILILIVLARAPLKFKVH